MKRKIAVIMTMALMTGLMGCQRETEHTTEIADSTDGVTISDEVVTEEKREMDATTESEESTEAIVETTVPDGSVTITFDYMSDNRKNANGEVILYVGYNRPVIEVSNNEEATMAIEQELLSDKDTFFINCNSLAEEAALVFAEEVPGDVLPAYEEDVNFIEKRIDDKVISFERYNYLYSGGAHGNVFASGMNFDVKTGKKLTIDDIAEDRDAFMEKVREYVLGLCQSDAYKDRLFPGYEENIDLVIQDDLWYFDKEGIVFISNPYELAAYAEGVLYFTIPYAELEGLQPEYAYTGGFQKSAYLGETITLDLDGDGTKDELMFNAEYSGDYEYVSSLTINGADYSQVLVDNQCYFAFPYEKYVVLDIDDSDRTLEIALQDYGMSDDPSTIFFQYDGNTLSCLGTIYDRISDLHITNDGKGTLIARERMGVFETAMIQVSYTIENEKLVREMQNLYPIKQYGVSEGKNEKTLLQDFVVYENMDLQSNPITIDKDEVIDVIATDDTEWVQIKDAEGNVYYVHLLDGFFLDVNGEEVPVADVFTPILMAG